MAIGCGGTHHLDQHAPVDGPHLRRDRPVVLTDHVNRAVADVLDDFAGHVFGEHLGLRVVLDTHALQRRRERHTERSAADVDTMCAQFGP